MGKANSCGSAINRTKIFLQNKGLKGGESGFGVPYLSISKGKYSPTKNGGKGRSTSL